MAICTQQLNVASIGRPVFEAAFPSIAGLGSLLGRRVFVVDVQRPEVAESAANTFSAETSDQRQLSLPVLGVLVDSSPILVPIRLLAFLRAKLRFAHAVALSAATCAFPSGGHIASLIAILPRSLSHSIGVNLVSFAAVIARYGNSVLLHVDSIAQDRMEAML